MVLRRRKGRGWLCACAVCARLWASLCSHLFTLFFCTLSLSVRLHGFCRTQQGQQEASAPERFQWPLCPSFEFTFRVGFVWAGLCEKSHRAQEGRHGGRGGRRGTCRNLGEAVTRSGCSVSAAWWSLFVYTAFVGPSRASNKPPPRSGFIAPCSKFRIHTGRVGVHARRRVVVHKFWW